MTWDQVGAKRKLAIVILVFGFIAFSLSRVKAGERTGPRVGPVTWVGGAYYKHSRGYVHCVFKDLLEDHYRQCRIQGVGVR